MLAISGSGTIFANRYPADWPVHAWYPNAVQLPSGDILCICRLGAGMYSDDGRIVQFRSLDNGETWLNEGVIRDGSRDDRTNWYAPSGVTLLSSGEIVMTGFRIHRPTPDTPTCNDETGACLPEETFLMTSADEGRTWTEPLVIQKPAGIHLEAYGSVIELPSGEWMQAFDVSKPYDDPAPSKARIVALLTANRGRSWSGTMPVAGSMECNQTFWHMRLVTIGGRPMGFAWTGDRTGQEFASLHRVQASADGKFWSEPEDTGIPGQTNCPADLGDGRVALVYTRRGGDAPGIYVVLSEDEGRSWRLQNQVQVWDAYGRESLGAPRTATYPSSHDNIAFGAPNLIRLRNNQLLASYWAMVAGQTVCRWTRLEVVR